MFNNLYHDFFYKKFFLFKFENYTYLFYLSMLIENICKFEWLNTNFIPNNCVK